MRLHLSVTFVVFACLLALPPAAQAVVQFNYSSGSPLIFSDVLVGSTSTQTVTVSNPVVGSADVVISSITLGAGVGYTQDSCGYVIPPSRVFPRGSSCPLVVSFTPTARGSDPGTVAFYLGPGDGYQYLYLQGRGVAPVISTDPSLDVGSQSVSGGAKLTTLVVTNSTTDTGQFLIPSSAVFSGGGASQFSIGGGSCTVTNGVSPNNGTCTYKVMFDPDSGGPKSTTLSISSNDPVTPTKSVTITGTGTAPEIAVTPSSLSFGYQLVDGGPAATQSLTVQNSGAEPLTYSASVFSSNFAVAAGTCPGVSGTVAANDSCTLLVSFDPSTAGALTDNVTITSNDADEPTTTIALSGTGTTPPPPAPQASLSPASLAFGTRPISTGPSAAQTVTMTNTGTVTVTVGASSIQGAGASQFVLGTGTCFNGQAIAPSATCELRVSFDPSAVGSASATLEWVHDGINQAVALSGTGCSFALAVSCPGADRIIGGARADVLFGGAGNDTMVGGLGADRLTGGAGNDVLNGGRGRDVLIGGAGNDRIAGGADPDTVRGDAGSDTIDVHGGGIDIVACGLGRDVVVAGPLDRVTGCEVVRRMGRGA